ncbi:MAG: hypothetical protein LH468_04020 [Nocardioides sp.]|nr:hypothetical protein [Nocardioides sp.]
MRRTTAALVLTTSLLLTACSSTDEGRATDESEPSVAASSATTQEEGASAAPSEDADAGSGDDIPADQVKTLALGAADFPAPYEYAELPPGALEQGNDAVGGALAGARYSPAECGNASQATQGADLSQSGVAIANDPATQSTVVAAVSPAIEQDVDIDELAERCASFTFSLTGPDGSDLTGDATLEVLPEPDVEADEARALSTSVTVSLGPQQQTVETVVYAAELRGVSVIASGSALTGAAIDQEVLAQLLTAGVAKVAAY